MSQTKEMTLEQAKQDFPLNLHWVDCREDPSCNEFPLKPLCPCFDPAKVKEYTKIPVARHILSGKDISGNPIKIILCDGCFDYNVKHQQKQQELDEIEKKMEIKI